MVVRSIDKASVDRFNNAVINPTVRSALRHFVHCGGTVDSASFIAYLGDLESFPALSVENVIAAATAAGLSMSGRYVPTEEIDDLPYPFLVFLRRSRSAALPIDMVQVERVGQKRVTLMRTRFATETIDRSEFEERWSGIVLLTQSGDAGESSDLARYRQQISVIPDMLSPAECDRLVDYCNAVKFEASRVLQGPHSKARSVIDSNIRSSFSAVLTDRRHHVLAQLYETCAAMEGVAVSDIEAIQCVRYERGQEFKPHFDGGVDLPRLTTFLLYLNDEFEDGDTYFTMLDHSVAAKRGACLRFPSCDGDGRILWQSEHGGLPVKSGVKYALNIWVRCPGLSSHQASAVARTQTGDLHQKLSFA